MKKIKTDIKNVNEDKKVNDFLKTIADTNRLRIICLLGKESFTVTQIYEKLKLPQNLTSHHISKLKKMELLNEKKEGTFRIYSVNLKKIREYNQLFKKVVGI